MLYHIVKTEAPRYLALMRDADPVHAAVRLGIVASSGYPETLGSGLGEYLRTRTQRKNGIIIGDQVFFSYALPAHSWLELDAAKMHILSALGREEISAFERWVLRTLEEK